MIGVVRKIKNGIVSIQYVSIKDPAMPKNQNNSDLIYKISYNLFNICYKIYSIL